MTGVSSSFVPPPPKVKVTLTGEHAVLAARKMAEVRTVRRRVGIVPRRICGWCCIVRECIGRCGVCCGGLGWFAVGSGV